MKTSQREILEGKLPEGGLPEVLNSINSALGFAAAAETLTEANANLAYVAKAVPYARQLGLPEINGNLLLAQATAVKSTDAYRQLVFAANVNSGIVRNFRVDADFIGVRDHHIEPETARYDRARAQA